MDGQQRVRAADPPVSGIRLGRIAGVQVEIDWSLLIIFALVTFSLGAQMLPAWHPDWSVPLRWLIAFVAAVLFFASVLAHELSHAIVGRRMGISVKRITLFMFGGMAHMENEPTTPRAELWMAIVGPITSAVIGLVAILSAWLMMGPGVARLIQEAPLEGFAVLTPAETILVWLGPINLMLAVFNMIPGFPLDGGRVFRALAWRATKNLKTATRWATTAGRIVAMLFMAAGTAMAFGAYIPFLGTGLGSGLWLILIGWFLYKAAHASYMQLLMREKLAHLHVADVMRRRFEVVDPSLSVEQLVRDHVMQTDQEVFPVVTENQLLGVVSLREARRVPPDRWAQITVQEIMVPAREIPTVDPQTDVTEALQQLEQQNIPQVPVVERGELRGILRGADVLKWIMLQAEEPAR